MTTSGTSSSHEDDGLPFTHPTLPIIFLFVAGLLVGVILILRNCCTHQLLPHHIQKRIARGGLLGRKRKDKNAEEREPILPQYKKSNGQYNPQQQQSLAYGSIADTRLFDDLDQEMRRRKEKNGKSPKLRMFPHIKEINKRNIIIKP